MGEEIVHLKGLLLTNFRNYSNLDLQFDERPTILLGNNAAGKSSVLEAIYLLSTTKSLRVEKEEEMIMDDKEFTKVEAILSDPEIELLIIINKDPQEVGFKKKVVVNGIPRKTVDFLGNMPTVIFHPSDINMVTGSPSLRRWHLDLTLAQIDSSYKRALTLYEQFLTSRNKVLKSIREGLGKLDELTYWTDELIKNGQIISQKRAEFFIFINNLEKPLGDFKFDYIQSVISLEKLKEYSDREIAAANTLIGPHRDDFTFFLEGKNMARFGSRGEQRTATLAFKLAKLEYMAKMLGKRPILLLDDVFSELDENHRAHVVDIVSKQQTIIATVELEHIPQQFLDSSRILNVANGKITS